MRPPKEKLMHLKREEIAEKFGVSDRTVVRWLKHYCMFERRGRGKLDMAKAEEMRIKHHNKTSIKKLAEEYGVSFSAASRAIHRITYRPDCARISVIYNPR